MLRLDEKKLLLLEDEPIVALMVEDIVKAMGAAEVLRVGELGQARRALQNNRFDAAIFDLNINGENSLDLAREIKEQGIPVLLATGYAQIAVEAEADFVVTTKPFTQEKLQSALARALA